MRVIWCERPPRVAYAEGRVDDEMNGPGGTMVIEEGRLEAVESVCDGRAFGQHWREQNRDQTTHSLPSSLHLGGSIRAITAALPLFKDHHRPPIHDHHPLLVAPLLVSIHSQPSHLSLHVTRARSGPDLSPELLDFDHSVAPDGIQRGTDVDVRAGADVLEAHCWRLRCISSSQTMNSSKRTHTEPP